MEPGAQLEKIARDLQGVLGAIRSTMASLSDEAVLELMADFEAIARLASAGQVHTAGEVGVRSRSELGDEGLSRSQNLTTPVALVAKVTGASARACKARLELGRKLRGAVRRAVCSPTADARPTSWPSPKRPSSTRPSRAG